MKKILFMAVGLISVALGVIGIFVPGLPTTPFLLLSSWLFYQSSCRLHDWLHRSALGEYIRRYESRQGMSRCAKLLSIVCMWLMIYVSAFVVLESAGMRVILPILGLIGTGCVLFVVPSAKRRENEE